MQLLMAVEERQAGVVRREVHFHFLLTADHDDVFHHARGNRSGEPGQLETVPVKMDRMDVVAPVAHAEAITLRNVRRSMVPPIRGSEIMALRRATQPGLARPGTDLRDSRAARSADEARGQQNDRGQQAEYAFEGDPHQPKRQQEQPHDRIEDQRQQSERPTEKEEEQPDQKRKHLDRVTAAVG
jgi:hypothetical protein